MIYCIFSTIGHLLTYMHLCNIRSYSCQLRTHFRLLRSVWNTFRSYGML